MDDSIPVILDDNRTPVLYSADGKPMLREVGFRVAMDAVSRFWTTTGSWMRSG